MNDDKCKFEETIDEKTGSIHIVNEYGCDWCDGVGVDPNGNHCGECHNITLKECDCYPQKRALKKERLYE